MLSGQDVDANTFNAQQAAIARGYDEYMSSTAYQRATEDMQAAGLNPAMMYAGSGGAATTPTSPAASASSGNNGSNMLNSILDSLMGVGDLSLRAATTKATIDNIKADTENKKEDTEGKSIDNEFKAPLYKQQLKKGNLSIKQAREEIKNLQEDTNLKIEQAKTEQEKQKLIIQQTYLTEMEAFLKDIESDYADEFFQLRNKETGENVKFISAKTLLTKAQKYFQSLENKFFKENGYPTAAAWPIMLAGIVNKIGITGDTLTEVKDGLIQTVADFIDRIFQKGGQGHKMDSKEYSEVKRWLQDVLYWPNSIDDYDWVPPQTEWQRFIVGKDGLIPVKKKK